MKKEILKFLSVLFVLFLSVTHSVFALDYTNGHFEKINADFPVFGQPIKLNNGKILIISDSKIISFNPTTNKFEKITNINDIDSGSKDIAILLANGKILLISPILEYPSSKFERIIYQLILDDLFKYKSIIFKDKKILTKRDAWYAYKHLPEKEKEIIFLPYIKKDPILFREYNSYLKEYDKSMYAQLYTADTNKFEYTGRLNIRRNSTNIILLDDGCVLLVGGFIQRDSTVPIGTVDEKIFSKTGVFELYNPITQKFTLIDTNYKFKNINKVILLNNGQVFIAADQTAYLYNLKNNKFTRSKHKITGGNFIKLDDDRIVFNTGLLDKNLNNTEIACYNPHNDEVSVIGKLLIPRGTVNLYKMTLLPDGNILINGGQNINKSSSFSGGAVYEDRAELFNPNTFESALLPKMSYKAPGGKSILLNDGRILFYFADANLYIPKGYKK